MNIEMFINELKELGIVLTKKQLDQLNQYYNILIEQNKVTNLTRIVDIEEAYLKHFYDSLTITKVIDLNKENTLCDVGTGAGFPGIVLKIVFPNLKVRLIDSTEKKVSFLKKVIDSLKLENIIAECKRIEDIADEYDVVTARAVAKLNVLIELCIPIVRVNGYFVAMKANSESEILEAENALKELGGEVLNVLEFNLPVEGSKRTLIKIRKNKKTSGKYPRKFDKILKNPL
mgnify:CR=1 FL=1